MNVLNVNKPKVPVVIGEIDNVISKSRHPYTVTGQSNIK
jgi:hypothetical protein